MVESMNLGTLMNLTLVGFIWGVTNPFIKRGTAGVNSIQDDNKMIKRIKELLFLVTNWTFMVPFVINQCGSVLYYLSLKDTDLTLAVPICNSLAFLCTALAGWWLGEEVPNRGTKIGMMMICFGISCYMLV